MKERAANLERGIRELAGSNSDQFVAKLYDHGLINSLYKELKEHPSLPEPFREYVDDVLPDTLDGIRRVNAIVGDLRRFARGDTEAAVEYDLNAEVRDQLVAGDRAERDVAEFSVRNDHIEQSPWRRKRFAVEKLLRPDWRPDGGG